MKEKSYRADNSLGDSACPCAGSASYFGNDSNQALNKLQRTPAMAYICGWFISFAVFEVVAVPFILLEQSFTLVVVVYTFLICVLLGISLWRGRNVLGEFAGQIKE